MRTLAVTSPMIQGKLVKHAQQLLHSNQYQQDYLQGDIDGAFGPLTARACIRAKYWLGYPRKNQRPVYGNQLDGYLTGKTKLPPELAAARKGRLADRAATKPLRERALHQAERDIGMKESPPNSNRCSFTRRWGMIGPWCAMAVSLWYIDAGSKAFRERTDWAYVPYLLSAAIDGRRGIALTTADRVKPGDIVTFDWDGGGLADHVGLFAGWVDRGRGVFHTIEGNTAIGNNSNGGQVMRRDRSLSQVTRARGGYGLIHVGR
jgi:hypothetical protein